MTLKKHASGEYIFRNPKWTVYDTIEVEVEHDEYGWIPFNATSYDEEDYGRELFEILSTKYADHIAPCPQEVYDAAAIEFALTRRGIELRDSDWSQLPDVPQATKDLWAPYRQALRDITEQPGYPHEINWPEPPV